MKLDRRNFFKLIGLMPATVLVEEEKPKEEPKKEEPILPYVQKKELKIQDDVPSGSAFSWSWSAPYMATGCSRWSIQQTRVVDLVPKTRKEEMEQEWAKDPLGVKASKFDEFCKKYG